MFVRMVDVRVGPWVCPPDESGGYGMIDVPVSGNASLWPLGRHAVAFPCVLSVVSFLTAEDVEKHIEVNGKRPFRR